MSIHELLNALNGLTDIHEEMLQLAREKQKLVVENRVDRLMTLTAKESKAIAAMEQLNLSIHRYTRECWAELGIAPKPGSTLADLLQAVTKAESKRLLAEAADRLMTSIQQLKEQNERNQLLVRQSLEYIAFQIDLITAPPDDMTYSPTKSHAAAAPRRSFDTRA
ncbi:flagellar protein FlgN [Cohnella candidum]|uniref:Flagellar protein FlgN n=1 Tax=Cohnella candidum TaxID=2674991 RepID=A0A3G3K0T7_9BACL|nr:flagellar protein FlgN [Cohnella candidum]AYQ74144.1 flagellar protein FlgN [Cohnella candidum]